jgi:hypothetical protein
MGPRRAHFVGSLPGDDAAGAMTGAARAVGGALLTVPDGETGPRREWIVPMVERLRRRPEIEDVRPGDWSTYEDIPRLRVRPGHRLFGTSIELGIAEAARAARPAFTALRAELGADRPVRFQVGIPSDLDLAFFAFGPAGPVRHKRAWTEALAAAMHDTAAEFGDDVVFQLEIPAELILLARTPAPARPAAARLLARSVTGLAQAAPAGARLGLHLCLGDLGHRSLQRLADAGPLVTLANAVAAGWPAGRTLDYVHLPLAAADLPPVTEPAFYRPLAGLALPAGVRVIGGYAHEDQDLATQLRVRDLVETAVGGPVDVATSCGLGRRTPAAAAAALARTAELL